MSLWKFRNLLQEAERKTPRVAVLNKTIIQIIDPVLRERPVCTLFELSEKSLPSFLIGQPQQKLYETVFLIGRDDIVPGFPFTFYNTLLPSILSFLEIENGSATTMSEVKPKDSTSEEYHWFIERRNFKPPEGNGKPLSL